MNIIEQKKAMRGQGGFTLIELLVVIAILAVLAGLAAFGLSSMRDNADKTACKADVDTYQTAAEAYNVANNAYPANGAALQTAGLLKRLSKHDSTMSINGTTGDVTNSFCP